ncbi:MAG: DNA primase [Ruminococcaceae bacterium]|nr:DNA primase [Oscillospiraceae bacterium]
MVESGDKRLFFSDDFINQVCDANEIADLISEYVPLKKSGRNLLGLCPFHNEKTPSFSVSSEKQFYHCFGCGEGGRVLDFVMKVEHLDFVEAVQFLAQRAHIPIPEEQNRHVDPKTVSEKENLYALNRDAAIFFHEMLYSVQGDQAREYFLNRSLSEATIKSFGLGYAPDSWDQLLKHLKQKGYSEKMMEISGLVGRKETRYYDSFRNRVIFPIIDLRGNVIGFGGRVLDDSKPKYLNSPESPVFSKSHNLYGLNFAKNEKERSLIVVEGYMDVIALHQAGIRNAVASLGTAFTPDHAKLMKRYADKITLCFDSDEAGQKATARCIEIMATQQMKVNVLVQDKAKDPDEYIKKFGKDSFLELVEQAPGQIEYRILRLKERYNLDDVEQKIAFVHEAANVFSSIESDIELELYIKKLSVDAGISPEAVFSEVQKISGKRRAVLQKAEERRDRRLISPDKLEQNEKILLGILYEKPELCRLTGLTSDFFSDVNHRWLFQMLQNNQPIVHRQLSPEQQKLLSEIAVRELHLENSQKAAEQLIAVIQHQKNQQVMTQGINDAQQLQQLLMQDKRSKHKHQVREGE